MLIVQKIFAREVELGNLQGPGVVPQKGRIGDQIAETISTVIGILTILAIIWFMIEFVVSGFLLISSSGDQEKTAEAKKRLTQSLTGLVFVLGAIFLFTIISYIANFDFLNVGQIINKLNITNN
jgi:hypothetical protein